ncbi:MAG: transcriptional regulator [Candidatus Omnitrophica bacterium]|nr:transcriptional regulator [Candidatus Omnitrophota bacterium]
MDLDDRKPVEEGKFAYEGLDRIMHEKARLGILTSLLTEPDGILFTDLKKLCSLTDGNLSRHLQALEKEGLVEVWKGFHKRRPQTLCRLSDEGRKRFVEYLDQLEQVLKDAAAQEKAARKKGKVKRSPIPEGWSPA